MVPLSYYLVLSGILFACGVMGFLIKRNIITIFMSIELMLNGVNLSFVAFAAKWGQLSGQVFVFVIMLLNAGEEERSGGSHVAWIIGVPGMLAGAVIICWALLRHSNAGTASIGQLPGHPADIAQLLFHQFLLPFEVTSILVLIAIMGAVVLAAPPESVQESKREG